MLQDKTSRARAACGLRQKPFEDDARCGSTRARRPLLGGERRSRATAQRESSLRSAVAFKDWRGKLRLRLRVVSVCESGKKIGQRPWRVKKIFTVVRAGLASSAQRFGLRGNLRKGRRVPRTIT